MERWSDGAGLTDGVREPHARRSLLLASGVAFALGLVLATRGVRVVAYDDAAITFRYADRLASGHGFTFNDGDRTNGASAPLYTLLLAVLRSLGADLETAARVLGVLSYAAALALVTWIAGRIAGVLAGIIGLALVLVTYDFLAQSVSGMESGFAAALGLLAVALWLEERELLAGFVLGLCLVNKFDAGLLAIGIGLAAVLVQRRFPARLAAASAVTLLPWLLFSQWYFGSMLPYSLQQKLGPVREATVSHDSAWMLDAFQRAGAGWLVALEVASGVLVVWCCTRWRSRDGSAALVACWVWGMLHLVAFSIVDLGDAYPWYRTVVYPALAIPAAVSVTLALRAIAAAVDRDPSAWGRRIAGVAAVSVLVLGGAAFTGRALLAAARGHEVDGYEDFESTRRAAGRYLGDHAEPGDVVETCFGWVEFGAIDQTIDETCPLSTRLPVGPADWMVLTSFPGRDHLDPLPAGSEVVATFESTTGEGGVSLVVRLPS